MDAAEIEVRTAVENAQLVQLMELFASAWWASDRTADDVVAMLSGSDLVFAAVHSPTDRLVGFARVLTDGVYLALVLDVIVATDLRGSGVGAALMYAIVRHQRLTQVRSVELVCQPDLMPFYRRWGFTDQVGRSALMRRSTDSQLTGLRPAES